MYTDEEIREIAESSGMSETSIRRRIDAGWPLEEVGNKKRALYTVNGQTGTITKLAEIFGINRHTVVSRIASGMSVEEAFTKEVKEKKRRLHIIGEEESKKVDQPKRMRSLTEIYAEKKRKGCKIVFVRTGAAGGYYTYDSERIS